MNEAEKDKSKIEDIKGISRDLRKAVNDTEVDIDTWIVAWAKSDWSLGIAIVFGLVLLAVGVCVGKFVL